MGLQTDEAEIEVASSNSVRDLVANRSHLAWKQKIGLLWNSLRENGIVWTSLLSMYYFSSGIAEATFTKLQKLKLERGLPGISSLKANKQIWEHWNWSRGGDEWTISPEWKESVINSVLYKYIPPGGHILEVGPGAGRWTGVLVNMTDAFTAVDIAESCVKICFKQFGSKPGARFLVGDGKRLVGVSDSSIDSIWSFDVFVHININDAASYVREFKRVMRPGSVGVVHHGRDGGLTGGWRSNLTSAAFRSLLADSGFTIVRAFQSWQDGRKEYHLGPQDEITVFRLQ